MSYPARAEGLGKYDIKKRKLYHKYSFKGNVVVIKLTHCNFRCFLLTDVATPKVSKWVATDACLSALKISIWKPCLFFSFQCSNIDLRDRCEIWRNCLSPSTKVFIFSLFMKEFSSYKGSNDLKLFKKHYYWRRCSRGATAPLAPPSYATAEEQ